MDQLRFPASHLPKSKWRLLLWVHPPPCKQLHSDLLHGLGWRLVSVSVPPVDLPQMLYLNHLVSTVPTRRPGAEAASKWRTGWGKRWKKGRKDIERGNVDFFGVLASPRFFPTDLSHTCLLERTRLKKVYHQAGIRLSRAPRVILLKGERGSFLTHEKPYQVWGGCSLESS